MVSASLPPFTRSCLRTMTTDSILREPIGIIENGPAGLINAHVLLQDGFTNIQALTRDASVSGARARNRVYPGLHINK
jgi:dimethylaniline monooxygenase (N-oxide forming)